MRKGTLNRGHNLYKGPEVGRLVWLELGLKGNTGKMRVGSRQGLEGSLVLWGGQWVAMGRLRAEIGPESQGSTSGFLRNGLAAHTPPCDKETQGS